LKKKKQEIQTFSKKHPEGGGQKTRGGQKAGGQTNFGKKKGEGPGTKIEGNPRVSGETSCKQKKKKGWKGRKLSINHGTGAQFVGTIKQMN